MDYVYWQYMEHLQHAEELPKRKGKDARKQILFNPCCKA